MTLNGPNMMGSDPDVLYINCKVSLSRVTFYEKLTIVSHGI